ncbi:MAG TPA: ParB/RepB/Spo0J family partition protein [bacterium]|nr:ParB/RepB/Spo0J family partition protein [bacterium]
MALAAARANEPRVVEIPLEEIDAALGAENPRGVATSSDHIEALAVAYLHGRPVPPILLAPAEDGRTKFVILDGRHRYRARQRILESKEFAHDIADDREKWTTIPATIFEGSPAQRFIRALEANLGHGLPLDLAQKRSHFKMAWVPYYKPLGRTQLEWAQIYGVHRTTIACWIDEVEGRTVPREILVRPNLLPRPGDNLVRTGLATEHELARARRVDPAFAPASSLDTAQAAQTRVAPAPLDEPATECSSPTRDAVHAGNLLAVLEWHETLGDASELCAELGAASECPLEYRLWLCSDVFASVLRAVEGFLTAQGAPIPWRDPTWRYRALP